MGGISNYAKIQSAEQKPKIKWPPIANGEFEVAKGNSMPISREPYIPSLHGDNAYYRNDGNKHIKSRGL